MLALALLLTAIAAEPEHVPKFTCEQVRAFVAEHGRAGAIALAVAYGATFRQIMEAQKCLK